jgi:hypothetical protein
MGKSPKSTLQFVTQLMGKSSETEFDFEQLKPKRPHGVPKWAKAGSII